MKKGELYEIITKLLEPVLTRSTLELVDMEYRKEGGKWFLRVFIDKPDSIQLTDCENVSKFLSSKLDASDLIPHQYILEVSSPGVERPLRKPEDFTRYRGSQVSLRTFDKFQGKRRFEGILIDYLNDQVVIKTDEGRLMIPHKLISQAKLKIF